MSPIIIAMTRLRGL